MLKEEYQILQMTKNINSPVFMLSEFLNKYYFMDLKVYYIIALCEYFFYSEIKHFLFVFFLPPRKLLVLLL